MLCSRIAGDDTQTAKYAVQFPVTAAKRKRSKTSVSCSSLKRFCQRTARRGEASAEVSRQLRMVCRSWPRCSSATFDQFQQLVHYQLLVQFWLLEQRLAIKAIANICKSSRVDDICFICYIYIYVEINSTLKLMKQNAMHYKWLQQPSIMHSDLYH